ncbi:MAG: cupredoxin family copper-binding protein [Gammaproteobacteria bacterium]|nr:cupredoxin family copper-binding protein [Gammaproteobacteria bacterium]MBU6510237.1 cupredoxin family copper-binding protein [Gammaproteobacteria bacterium]MDE1984590.1 cupredoxin family copper-binding protein [Gammaproteobacteria bacterium]MDE2462035.1 cupredoxin family copper-binding protein [Gammaproteobacteria bacterium]
MKRPTLQIILSLILVPAALVVFRAAAANSPARAITAPLQAATVSISNFSFQPAVLTLKAGARVTWTNHDTTPHTVTSSDKRFTSSGGLDTGDQYSIVFDKPGAYEYFCSLHPMMVGKVIVQPSN